jgi:hypothetical protein
MTRFYPVITCFCGLESKDLKDLVLITYRLARGRALDERKLHPAQESELLTGLRNRA